jgi:hypothetical protein
MEVHHWRSGASAVVKLRLLAVNNGMHIDHSKTGNKNRYHFICFDGYSGVVL